MELGRWARSVPRIHVRNHVDFRFCLSKLLLGGDLGLATEQERHVEERVGWFVRERQMTGRYSKLGKAMRLRMGG